MSESTFQGGSPRWLENNATEPNVPFRGLEWPRRKQVFPFCAKGVNGEKKKDRKDTELLHARNPYRGIYQHYLVKSSGQL